jgi:hypothetical protein
LWFTPTSFTTTTAIMLKTAKQNKEAMHLRAMNHHALSTRLHDLKVRASV